MSKKLMVLVVALLIVLGLFCGLFACNSKLPNSLEYVVEDGEVKIKFYSDVIGVKEVTVPDEVDGMPVTTLKDFSIANSDNLERIVIGKNVKTIDGWALKNNQKLVEFVVHPENVYFKAVDGVLYNYDLTELYVYPCGKEDAHFTIPEGVKTLKTKAFYKCKKLNGVTFPSTLEVIEEKAFMYDERITSITFNQGLKRIEKDAFSFCAHQDLTEITIPSSVEYVGEYAFYNSSNIVTINVERTESECDAWSKDWKPTNNGLTKSELKINYKK